MARAKTVRIGCASGFWGDSAIAAPQLLRRAEIDYLVFDYLAEITMAIMARAKARDGAAGYATDFVAAVMPEIARDLAARGVKLVANAGGVNPLACRQALEALLREAGLSLRVAVVLGDDLMPRLDRLRAAGIREMFTGAPLPERPLSVNAYLGAFPIAAALARGADIVITGRCVDSALVLGPLLHAFGWGAADWDLLAAGSLAGHIVECGAQATGGLFTDWRLSAPWEDIGYPIVECAADGTFTVTKPEGTGGLVARGTVAEQMLYEVGDPAAYVLPDVVCDFTQVTLEETGRDRVRVRGARGRPAPGCYKVSATWLDGYRLSTTLTLCGAEAAAKARQTGEALLARTRAMFRARGLADYDETLIETLGAEDSYGPHGHAQATREVVMRLSARHRDKRALELLAAESASPVTSMAPGTSGYLGGRQRPQAVARLFSFLLPKAELEIAVDLDGRESVLEPAPLAAGGNPAPVRSTPPPAEPAAQGETVRVPLLALAWGRSGDKGNHANIAVIARRPDYLPPIRAALTEEAVAGYFRHLCEGPVRRFEVPGIAALNFLLENALGGGGMVSLRSDPQGKTFAQMLLGLAVPVPAALARRDRLPILD